MAISTNALYQEKMKVICFIFIPIFQKKTLRCKSINLHLNAMQKPILLYPFRVICFLFALLIFSINLGFAQNKKPATAGRRSYFTFGYGQAVYGSNFGESNLLRFGYEQRFADNFGVETYTHIIRYQTSRENFTNYDLRLRLLYHFEKRFQPQIVVEPVSNIRHHKSKLPSQRL
jgi:hypothetical protein